MNMFKQTTHYRDYTTDEWALLESVMTKRENRFNRLSNHINSKLPLVEQLGDASWTDQDQAIIELAQEYLQKRTDIENACARATVSIRAAETPEEQELLLNLAQVAEDAAAKRKNDFKDGSVLPYLQSLAANARANAACFTKDTPAIGYNRWEHEVEVMPVSLAEWERLKAEKEAADKALAEYYAQNSQPAPRKTQRNEQTSDTEQDKAKRREWIVKKLGLK